MLITLKKFGSVLTSRQAGQEARAAFMPTLAGVEKNEEVLVDFEGVASFSPSWGDEFLTPLQKTYGKKLHLKNTENPSVALTLTLLEEINGAKFHVTK